MTILGWSDVNAWRKEKRQELLSSRLSRPVRERKRVRDAVAGLIAEQFPRLRGGDLGFYWPFRGELDLRDMVMELTAPSGTAALPVVVERNQPVEFWAWHADMKMEPGIWNIPVPITRVAVRPEALFIPLVGFDDAGYRLGYGGGYYDRTLGQATERPLAIGVGYSVDRVPTIHPQPHDVPMDAIVTEDGINWISQRALAFRRKGGVLDMPGERPCSMEDADPAYMGFLTTEETVEILNELLEGERAGARGVMEMVRATVDPDLRVTLSAVARDEARYCAMLYEHIERLGGRPSAATGPFLEKLQATSGRSNKIVLLNKGQSWVSRKLAEILPKISDAALYKDLSKMRVVHDRNVERCARYAGVKS